MRSRRPERPAPRIPISEAVPGRRPPAGRGGDGGAAPARRGANVTVVALAIGVLLMAAALLLPSAEPSDAVPGDALQPVAAVEPGGEGVDLGDLSAGGDTSVASDDGAWAALDEATTPTTPGRERAAKGGPSAEEGSSSASVAGDDLDAAVRAETKRAKERAKAAAARKRSRARRAARARTKARQRARARERAAAPSSSSRSTAAPPATAPAATPAPVQAAPPVRSAPRSAAPRRSGGSKGSVRKEFGGGL